MFKVVYVKDGKVFIHPTKFESQFGALSCGHEMTRDYVADFFKVVR